jgi:membrane-bound ClpP family serine protease
MRGIIIIALLTVFTVVKAEAATITVNPPEHGMTLIAVTGEIVPGDDRRFAEIARSAKSELVVVNLSGPGGDLAAGLRIGTTIHDRGWTTRVPKDSRCNSTCAYIWIAGIQRGVTTTSYIGFHAAYDRATQQESGAGNAVLGSYLTKLGLNYDGIAYLTTSGPTQMTYLSAEAAAKYGIAIGFGELPSENRLVPLPGSSPASSDVFMLYCTGGPPWTLTIDTVARTVNGVRVDAFDDQIIT